MKKIRNYDDLILTPTRRDALDVLEEGLQSIDTHNVIRSNVVLHKDCFSIKGRKFPLPKRNIYIVGIGKCAFEACKALSDIFADVLTGGFILGVDNDSLQNLDKFEYYKGTHPLPSDRNITASQALVSFLEKTTESDLVIFIISGGGSTLLCLPESGTCLEEKEIVQDLIHKGASIEEMNTVRKHISYVRGGNLAKYAFPSRVVSLIFSDVPGNDISYIASGPTVKDVTTVENALEIISKYNVLQSCGIDNCGLIETPKEDKYFKNVSNILFLSNKDALDSMKTKAESLGYRAVIQDEAFNCSVERIAQRIRREIHEAPQKTMYLYGGESTVHIQGSGKGGRSLELALRVLRSIDDSELIITCASDGYDNSDFAGAVADTVTLGIFPELILELDDIVKNNNSYIFWEKTKQALITGATGSNISDLIITVKT